QRAGRAVSRGAGCRLRVADVELDADRIGAELASRVGGRPVFVLARGPPRHAVVALALIPGEMNVSDGDLRPGASELERDRAADTSPGTRDRRDLTSQRKLHCSVPANAAYYG